MGDARTTLPEGTGKPLYVAYIKSPIAPLFNRKNLRQGLQTELLRGQGFQVYKEGRNWVWGAVLPLISQSQRPAYIGYIAKSRIDKAGFKVTHNVSALRALVFSDADIKSPITETLPLNARVCAVKQADNFWQLDRGGYIHERHVSSVDVPPSSTDFVSVAEQFLDMPYVWGGTGFVGVDCSGLVQMALCAVGLDAPRDADMQEQALGQPVHKDLQRGDLIFWAGHVGIMWDAKTLLHANAFHMKTAKEPYEAAVSRIGTPRSIKRLS